MFCPPPFYPHHQVLIAGYVCHLNQITCRVCFTSWTFAKEAIRMEVKCHHGVALNFTTTPGHAFIYRENGRGIRIIVRGVE